MIRIANGQGFWGDWLEAPLMQIRGGSIDYLTLDYLAEVTMSIPPKQSFTRELAPLALNGPPVVTYVGGRPKVEEVVAYWPALIPKSEILPQIQLR